MSRSALLLSALVLGGFALIGTTLVSFTHGATAARIAGNQRQALLQELESLSPRQDRDNDLLRDVIEVEAPAGQTGVTMRVYRARREGEPVAAIFTPVIARGYAGPMELIVAVYADGSLAGVRVLQHRETPGLGDKVELQRSPWILDFNRRSLEDPAAEGWRVKRDGGVFDQFSGATITPRGVVAAVHTTLSSFQAHRQRLFAQSDR